MIIISFKHYVILLVDLTVREMIFYECSKITMFPNIHYKSDQMKDKQVCKGWTAAASPVSSSVLVSGILPTGWGHFPKDPNLI